MIEGWVVAQRWRKFPHPFKHEMGLHFEWAVHSTVYDSKGQALNVWGVRAEEIASGDLKVLRVKEEE